MRIAEENRIQQAASKRAVRSIFCMLRTLNIQIEEIDRDADQQLGGNRSMLQISSSLFSMR